MQASFAHDDVCRALLTCTESEGASKVTRAALVDARDVLGETALMKVHLRGCSPRSVELLLYARCTIQACTYGHREIVDTLLEFDAAMTVCNSAGNTALDMAVSCYA